MSNDDSNTGQPQEPSLSPKRDLANRYQSMVDDQFRSVSNFEDKAWRAIRANIALIGLYLTGLSILLNTSSNASPSINIVDLPPIIIGIISLFISLILAVIVLLGIKIGFGPSTDIADTLIESNLNAAEYDSLIVTNYSKTIQTNWGVLEDKSRRLRKAFALLVFGLIEISLGLLFVITPTTNWMWIVKVVILVIVTAAALYVGRYIWNQSYESIDGNGENETTEDSEPESEDEIGNVSD